MKTRAGTRISRIVMRRRKRVMRLSNASRPIARVPWCPEGPSFRPSSVVVTNGGGLHVLRMTAGEWGRGSRLPADKREITIAF